MKCKRCWGTGLANDIPFGKKICPKCKGIGKMRKPMKEREKKCQVILNTERRLEYVICGNKAVASIIDIGCPDTFGKKKPFYVCRKHKKMFLTGGHYKLVENL